MSLPDLPPEFNCCVCPKAGGGKTERFRHCLGDDGFDENGKKIKLKAERTERVKAIILDGCLLTNQNKLRCDGLFLFFRTNEIFFVLIELKGTDIEHACKQLSYVKNNCDEYKDLLKFIKDNMKINITEKCFIVSPLGLKEVEKYREEYERQYNISFRFILPGSNLRKQLVKKNKKITEEKQ